jgi:hypothetical protein
MLDFILDNPCEFYQEPESNKDAVFAVNAEQRILRGVSNYFNLKVKAFDTAVYSTGITPSGVHLYYWRLC